MNRKRSNRYSYLATIAMICVPLAPSFFFAWRIYGALISLGVPPWLATPIAAAGAIGLELVGILAGHTMMVAWRLQDYPRTVLSGLIMGVYVVIGVMELWGGIGAVMFLIAPLVYVLSALQEGLGTAVTQRDQYEEQTQAFQMEQQRADAEQQRKIEVAKIKLEYELSAEEKRLNAQVKIEQARARVATKQSREQAKNTRTEVDTYGTDWRTLTETEKLRMADFTPDEIVQIHNVSRKTAMRWLEKSGQMSVSVQSNGNGQI